MKIREIIQHLEHLHRLEYQEEYDNSGLIAGDIELECTGVLLNLDCTEEVFRKQSEKNVILSFPIIR